MLLAGSHARGEGLLLQVAGEPPRPLSDLDVYLCLEHEPPGPALARARARLEHAVRPAGLDLGTLLPGQLAADPARIPAQELRARHQVIWRGEGVEPSRWLPPAVQPSPSDALRLVHNRMAEWLLEEGGQVARGYRTWKLWSDLPLAFLAAHGQYDPDRASQLRRVTSCIPAGAPADLAGGLARLRELVDARARCVVDEGILRGLAATDPRPWAWPLHRAVLDAVLGPDNPGDPAEALGKAVAAGPAGPGDTAGLHRWLRRRPWPVRMREARRWHPLGPPGLRPWWSYGWGGSGPDRTWATAALRFAGLDGEPGPIGPMFGGDAGGQGLRQAFGAFIRGEGRR